MKCYFCVKKFSRYANFELYAENKKHLSKIVLEFPVLTVVFPLAGIASEKNVLFYCID